MIGLWVLRGKVIAATNRPDTLDPALLRSGRLDRKIELPAPSEDSRARIMQIHSRKMNIDKEGKSGTLGAQQTSWALLLIADRLLAWLVVCVWDVWCRVFAAHMVHVQV